MSAADDASLGPPELELPLIAEESSPFAARGRGCVGVEEAARKDRVAPRYGGLPDDQRAALAFVSGRASASTLPEGSAK